jgi:hypothetical protein
VGTFLVLSDGRGEDEEVVHINNQPPFIQLLGKGLIHIGLESRRGVAKAKEHYFWFIQAKFGRESGLPSVIRVDPNIIVSGMNVHLGEVCRIAKLRDQGGNEGKRVCILHCPFVNIPVILTRSQHSVFLSYKKESTSLRGL